MQRTAGLFIALATLLLASCSGQQTQTTTDTSWAQHSARLQQLDHWTAEGKLALRTAVESTSASIRWVQQGASVDLFLSGPMGLSATTIQSDGHSLTVRQGDEVRNWDLSDSEAMARESGWALPLEALPYWLKGLPAPNLDIQLLEQGPDSALLQALRQDGWDIRYQRYDNFGDHDQYGPLALPTRLSVQREGTSVRLIIRDWQLPGSQ